MLAQTLAALVAAVTLAACSQPDRAVWTAKDEPKMLAAMTSAREALPVFWAKVDARDPNISETLVKVGYPTRHDGVEYLWMAVQSHDASVVRGRLLNEPEDVAGVHADDAASVDVSKIADWAYRKDGKYYGQFTTRVMLESVDAKTRQEQSESLAPTPLEPTSH
jgi:uncharacterized protein YegJ (DUF2314 family)